MTVLHIVTDSTSDILPSEAAALGVRVVPLTVRFGEEQFRDGVDLDADAFYARLARGGISPTTSQPSPEDFAAVYRELLREPGDRVLSIHISQKLSGTLQSATLAAQELEGRVSAVDSGSVSMGIQFLVRAALRDLAAGADVDTVVRNTEARRSRLVVYVLLDTLTYLHRGGRIGAAQAFLGGVLNVKPLLRIAGGVVHPQARVRNRRQGIDRMLALLAEAGPLEAVGTMHSGAPRLLEEVRPRLTAAYPELELGTGQIGPVVGTYAGPGAIGAACLRAG
ncbi:MAG: DegV family protein [Chloroflexi bacterium]|nr:MAG: DegV family protein [Chloroflexota bacterium]